MTEDAGRWTWCPVHEKRRYHTKDYAKQAIRDLHERGMREYPCTLRRGWHIGHLPTEVRTGQMTITEYYEGFHDPAIRADRRALYRANRLRRRALHLRSGTPRRLRGDDRPTPGGNGHPPRQDPGVDAGHRHHPDETQDQ